MPSTPPRSSASWAGRRGRASPPASARPCAGTSITRPGATRWRGARHEGHRPRRRRGNAPSPGDAGALEAASADLRQADDLLPAVDADARRHPGHPGHLEARGVLRRRDDQDGPDAGEHQRRQRVVDHRLVVDRQKLLREHLRHRVKARSRTAGEDDAFHAARLATASLQAWLSRYQRTVLRMPEANVSRGAQPSSRLILLASMAYRRSWPSRSFTNVIRSAYLPFLRGSASSRRSQMVATTSLLNFSLFPPML